MEPNYAQHGIEGKCCHFIYLIKDEVMDKAPKQSMTLIEHTNKTTNETRASDSYYNSG
jgi:hypothetical protein